MLEDLKLGRTSVSSFDGDVIAVGVLHFETNKHGSNIQTAKFYPI